MRRCKNVNIVGLWEKERKQHEAVALSVSGHLLFNKLTVLI